MFDWMKRLAAGKSASPRPAPSDPVALLNAFVEHQFETDRMIASARSSERGVVVLNPQIPIGQGPIAGWFGGQPALPPGMVWPERDGEKLLFMGQIDLAALPEDLWSGIGPRSGWLVLFMPEEVSYVPTVLHVDGPQTETEGPPHRNACWTSIHDFKTTNTFRLPKWPLVVEARKGNDMEEIPSGGLRYSHQPNLLDPAYRPFDRATVSLLLRLLAEEVTNLARLIFRFPSGKKIHPRDAAWFQRQKSIAQDTFARFFEIEGRMAGVSELDAGQIAGLLGELAELDSYTMEYLRNDADGVCELNLNQSKLLDWHSRALWWFHYECELESHAIEAYTSGAADLPTPMRDRLEVKWRESARGGLAAMGHAPQRHIYTPHGPATPNEVLLEIHTSNLVGWIWGDCRSIVLLIEREALRRGDFSQVTYDISN